VGARRRGRRGRRRRRGRTAVVPESKLAKTEWGLLPTDKGWFVVNARVVLARARGTRRAHEVRRLRPGDRLRPARDQYPGARARPPDVDVPLGGRPGGLPRPGRRGARDRRGRGASNEGLGPSALPGAHGP